MGGKPLIRESSSSLLHKQGLMNTKIENAFSYHYPKPGMPEQYKALRDKAKELAYEFERFCPESREKSLAFTKLEESIMWANASIARNP
jgi:hypothetical protein